MIGKLKSTLENHPFFVLVGIISVGFIAGIKVDQYFWPHNGQQITISDAQVEIMIKKHNERIDELQRKYLEYEKEATDLGHLDGNQKKYADAAARIKDLIATQNDAFIQQINKLEVRSLAR